MLNKAHAFCIILVVYKVHCRLKQCQNIYFTDICVFIIDGSQLNCHNRQNEVC